MNFYSAILTINLTVCREVGRVCWKHFHSVLLLISPVILNRGTPVFGSINQHTNWSLDLQIPRPKSYTLSSTDLLEWILYPSLSHNLCPRVVWAAVTGEYLMAFELASLSGDRKPQFFVLVYFF